MTTIRYTPQQTLILSRDGIVLTEVSLQRVASIDSDLDDTVARAQQNPGTEVPVPNTSRVPRPRNSRVYGVSQ